MRALLTASALAGLFSACGSSGGSGGSTFDYSTSSDTRLILTVTDSSGPLRGVAVTIEDVETYDPNSEDSADGAGQSYFRGLTDANGQLEAVFSVPATVRSVDVVAHLPGYTGTWSNVALKDSLGPFAPTSRTTKTLASEMTVNLTMEAR